MCKVGDKIDSRSQLIPCIIEVKSRLTRIHDVITKLEATSFSAVELQSLLSSLPENELGIEGHILGLIVEKLVPQIEGLYKEYYDVNNFFDELIESSRLGLPDDHIPLTAKSKGSGTDDLSIDSLNESDTSVESQSN